MYRPERLEALERYRPLLVVVALLFFGLNCFIRIRQLHVLAGLVEGSEEMMPQPFSWAWMQVVLLHPLIILAIMLLAIFVVPLAWRRWEDRARRP